MRTPGQRYYTNELGLVQAKLCMSNADVQTAIRHTPPLARARPLACSSQGRLRFIDADELSAVKFGIEAIPRQKLSMCSLLDDLAMIDHQDLVGPLNGGEAVSDHQGCTPGHELLYCILDQGLGIKVYARRRLVEDQDTR